MKKLKSFLLLLIILPSLLFFTACGGDSNNNDGDEAPVVNYNVTFKLEGQVYETKQVKSGEKVEKPTEPKISNYLFMGWYNGEIEWNFETGVVNSDLTLKAKFDFGYTSQETVVTGITDYGKTLTELNIAEGMTEISKNAFKDCSNLESVTIPKSVEIIWNGAFQNCNNLEKLTIPFVGGSETYNTYLGYIFGANNYSKNKDYVPLSLKEVIVTNCSVIGSYGFYNCNKLISIKFFEGVTNIGSYSIEYCSSLKSVEIPSSVTTISEYAFAWCSNLSNVIFNKNSKLENIGSFAFRDCENLTSIEIPNKVKYIGSESFKGCSSLTNIVIPKSVESIESGAFFWCDGLTSVTFENASDWIVSSSKSMSNAISLSSEDLANPTIAATYLTSTYDFYYWKRG